MNRTQIEWVKNPDGAQGYTWNPITGCLKGCPYCYARKLANGRLRTRYLANENIVREGIYPGQTVLSTSDPFYPRFWPEKLKQSLGDRPSGVFICNMGELFAPWIPDGWTKAVLQKLRAVNYDEHRFYLLTKQPQELVKWSPFPDNCWVGVSATDAESFYDATAELSKVEATVKYISFEPLLGEINGGECEGKRLDLLAAAGISWLIIGAQTKPTVLPEIAWVREIVEAADQARIPVFLKNSMWPLLLPVFLKAGCINNYFTEDGNLRQEMPA